MPYYDENYIFTWHVVSNEVGTILSVWGEALLADAQRAAKAIQEKTGCATYLHHIKGDRPHVGQSISMKGVR